MNTNHSFGDVLLCIVTGIAQEKAGEQQFSLPIFSKAPGSMALLLLCIYYYSGNIHME